jgi:hypothetical protein
MMSLVSELDELESRVFQRQLAERLSRYKSMNTERDLEIFFDRVFRGFTYRALAEMYDLSPDRIHKIVAKLCRISHHFLTKEKAFRPWAE